MIGQFVLARYDCKVPIVKRECVYEARKAATRVKPQPQLPQHRNTATPATLQHILKPLPLTTMSSYQEKVVLNREVTQQAPYLQEYKEPTEALWFRKFCGKVARFSTSSTSLNFDQLIGNCSKSTPRSEEAHSRLESEASTV